MIWFNQKQNAVLGLDISTAAVKLLELSKVGTRFRVESYAVSPLPQEAFVDKNIANIDIIAEAVKNAVKQSGTKLRQACVAVSGSAVMSKVITIPASLPEAEIEDHVLEQAKAQADAATARAETVVKNAEEREKAAAEKERLADEKAAKAEAAFQRSMRK